MNLGLPKSSHSFAVSLVFNTLNSPSNCYVAGNEALIARPRTTLDRLNWPKELGDEAWAPSDSIDHVRAVLVSKSLVSHRYTVSTSQPNRGHLGEHLREERARALANEHTTDFLSEVEAFHVIEIDLRGVVVGDEEAGQRVASGWAARDERGRRRLVDGYSEDGGDQEGQEGSKDGEMHLGGKTWVLWSFLE